jgi:hypothetical protein
MNRWLTGIGMIVCIAMAGCDGSIPTSPTRVPPPPGTGVPEAPAPLLPESSLSGTMTVTTALAATGGYQYTVRIDLAESGGVAATITSVELGHVDAWGPYPPFARFGPEAWASSNIVPARGTLTSMPLVTTEDFPSDYYCLLGAKIQFSDATSTSRSISLTAQTPPMPEPPPNARFNVIGTVVDEALNPLPDVTIEVLNGPNAGRQTKTDGSGK